jgi:hypothetical protein
MDIDVQVAVVSAVAALLGAGVGGVGSYLATHRMVGFARDDARESNLFPSRLAAYQNFYTAVDKVRRSGMRPERLDGLEDQVGFVKLLGGEEAGKDAEGILELLKESSDATLDPQIREQVQDRLKAFLDHARVDLNVY